MVLLYTGMLWISREQTKTKLFPNFESAPLLQQLAYLEESFRRLDMLTRPMLIRRETPSVEAAEKVPCLWITRLEMSLSAAFTTLCFFISH